MNNKMEITITTRPRKKIIIKRSLPRETSSARRSIRFVNFRKKYNGNLRAMADACMAIRKIDPDIPKWTPTYTRIYRELLVRNRLDPDTPYTDLEKAVEVVGEK